MEPPTSNPLENLTRRLSALWNRLTVPVVEISDYEARLKSQWLASLLLGILPLSVLVNTFPYLIGPRNETWLQYLELPALLFVAIAPFYFLARRGRYRLASYSVFVIAVAGITLAIAVDQVAPEKIFSANLYIMPMLFSSLMFTRKEALIHAAIISSLLAVLPLFVPGLEFRAVVTGPLNTIIIAASLSQLGAWLRISVNNHHMVALKRLNEDLQAEIAERKQIAEALRQSEARLRTLTDNIHDMVCQLDRHGIVQYASPSFYPGLGLTPDALVGREARAYVHPDDLETTLAQFQDALSKPEILVECRALHAAGHYIWVEVSGQAIPDNEGQLASVVVVCRDITLRRKLQALQLEGEKLRFQIHQEQAINSQKTKVMMRIAHEFRTPLTVIALSSEILNKYLDQLAPEQRHTQIVRMQVSVRQLTGILDNIITVLRSEFGQLQPNRSTFALKPMCNEVIAELYNVVGDVQSIQLDIASQVQSIEADRGMVHAMLVNLLSNAMKFSPKTKDIAVKIDAEDDAVVVRVTDRGIGIPESDLGRIFTPFFRASNIEEIRGIGLGLHVTKNAVEAHGGQIAVESTLGHGTTVTVRLPNAVQPTSHTG